MEEILNKDKIFIIPTDWGKPIKVYFEGDSTITFPDPEQHIIDIIAKVPVEIPLGIISDEKIVENFIEEDKK